MSSAESEKTRKSLTSEWMCQSIADRYSYNFSCLGRPIIQYPQDMVAMQELIWQVRPDLIVETGIAHGGSLMLSASMLAILEYCDCAANGELLDPANPKRKVIAVDIDIRSHNNAAIDAHPMRSRIEMIEGSSISQDVITQIKEFAAGYDRILVCLDSNHTHDHVLAELNAYAPLVSQGSYCVVFDTIVENLPEEMFPDRPWGRGDNPMTAMEQFLIEQSDFEIDHSIDDRLQFSVAPQGYLRRI